MCWLEEPAMGREVLHKIMKTSINLWRVNPHSQVF